jgi:hypothetical protein
MRAILVLLVGIGAVLILGEQLPAHQARVAVPVVATGVALVVYRLIMRARSRLDGS